MVEVKPDKREIPEEESNKDLAEAVDKSLCAEIERVIQIGDKQERETATKELHDNTAAAMAEEFPE